MLKTLKSPTRETLTTHPHSGTVIISLNGLIQVELDPTPGRRVPSSRKRLLTLNVYQELANYIHPGYKLTWRSPVKNYNTTDLLGGRENSPIDVKVTLPPNGVTAISPTFSLEGLDLWQPNLL
jgi:hypothetical protein